MTNPQPPMQANVSDSSGMFSMSWVMFFSALSKYIGALPASGEALGDYANDAAAAAGDVPLYGYYRNGSVVMQRVV